VDAAAESRFSESVVFCREPHSVTVSYCCHPPQTRSVRGQYDHYTSIGGGVGAGLFCGSRSRNPATAVLYGMGFGAAALTSHMTGGSTMQESKHYELLKTIRTV